MSKRTICTTKPPIAYYSGFNGLEVHHIEYGPEDYVYCTSGAWGGGKQFHRLKIRYTTQGRAYVQLYGYRAYLDEFIRTGV